MAKLLMKPRGGQDPRHEAIMEYGPLFQLYSFGLTQREILDRDGHLTLQGLLTDEARQRVTEALSGLPTAPPPEVQRAQHYSAEHNDYLASLIGHPQLLGLARQILGPDVRFDHCVSLNRPSGDEGSAWHRHAYAEDRPELVFIRVFLYVNGFTANDGGLGVVPGSHLCRDPALKAASDEALRTGWMGMLTGTRSPSRVRAGSRPSLRTTLHPAPKG